MNFPTITFFSNSRMDEFWTMVKSLLFTSAPMVMIWVAIVCIGLLLALVVKAFKKANEDDNDDDYEKRYY